MGLVPAKKLDLRLTDAGEGGNRDKVSIVRSDKDGRVPRTRPRSSYSRPSPLESKTTASSCPPSPPSSSSTTGSGSGLPLYRPDRVGDRTGTGAVVMSLVWFVAEILGRGLLNIGSSDGRRSRAAFNPGSARNRSLDGDGLTAFGAVDVGSGSREAARRGTPLVGREGVFASRSMLDG